MKLALTLLLFPLFSYSQDFYTIIKEDTLQRERVLACSEITYYGLDFSHFNLVNGKKIGDETEVAEYIPTWITLVNKQYIHNDKFSYQTDRTIEDLQEYVQHLHLARTDKWITYTRTPLLLDSIQKIVRSTDYPAAKHPIGLVVIVGALVKDNESVYVNFVFFDTASKDVLWRVKIEGYNKNNGGMASRWRKGLNSCYRGMGMYWRKESN